MKSYSELTPAQQLEMQNKVIIPVFDLGIAIEFRNGQRQYYDFQSNSDMEEVKNRIIKTNEFMTKQLAIFKADKNLTVKKKNIRPVSRIERIGFYFAGQRVNTMVEYKDLPAKLLTDICSDTLKATLDLMCEVVTDYVDQKEKLAIDPQIVELLAELNEN